MNESCSPVVVVLTKLQSCSREYSDCYLGTLHQFSFLPLLAMPQNSHNLLQPDKVGEHTPPHSGIK
jgi:hypothetical protein